MEVNIGKELEQEIKEVAKLQDVHCPLVLPRENGVENVLEEE